MRFGGLILVTLVTACGAGGAGDPSGSDGKADEVSDGSACFRGYSTWLLTRVSPVLKEDPVNAVLFRTLSDDEPCEDWESMAGTPAYDTWHGLVMLHVAEDYFAAYHKAFEEYHQGDSHSKFVEKTRLADGLRTKLQLLLQIRPTVSDGLSFRMWMGAYYSIVTQLTLPLEKFGTTLPFDEGYFDLNESEAEFLTLIESTRPRVVGDDGYAAWVEEFQSLIYDGTQVGNQDDDFSHFERSSPARDRLIERYEALRPPPVGPQDHAQWMWLFALAAETARLDNPQEMAQLKLVERVRPERLRGDEAYRPWLETYEGTLSNSEMRDGHVLPVKPCATGDASRQLYQTFRAAHASTPEEVLAAADPARCN